ncbi:hypothetical protein WJX81_008067 [Elliptochloris bilobata]|uniref:LrgB family protein n=1 Tax=Elliptochloris bilobata TaxID=381761 RepID=A0AAW1QIP4_9CHLO
MHRSCGAAFLGGLRRAMREASLPRQTSPSPGKKPGSVLRSPLRALAGDVEHAHTPGHATEASGKELRLQPALAARRFAQKAAALTTLYALNKALAVAVADAGLHAPSALIGMFGVIAALAALTRASREHADAVAAFFAPALDWIQRWLPLFYVPSLIMLPLALRDIAGRDMAKILAIIGLGMPASLLFTAQVAVGIRALCRTQMEPQPPPRPQLSFSRAHHVGWGIVAVIALAAAVLGPPDLAAVGRAGFLLAATVLGFLAGSALPPAAARLAHPLVVCAAAANLGAAALGALTGAGYLATLRTFLTKGAGGAPWGAGDLLMSFLGVVILHFGFRIHAQRRLMMRHGPEILGSTALSALFSLFATAAAARAAGLEPGLARALVPRSVTVALALPIAERLGAPAPVVAACVVLTGLLGANLAQPLLDRCAFWDPIARGLATAGSAHGLGTAALARSEPEALPFCALAYALTGVISTALVAVPPVASALLAITA